MINRSSAQGRRSTEEDSNTMTTPTFNTLQLDIPETAVADPVATPRQSQRGGIDTARFWAVAASVLYAVLANFAPRPLFRLDCRPGHATGRAASPYHRSRTGRSVGPGG